MFGKAMGGAMGGKQGASMAQAMQMSQAMQGGGGGQQGNPMAAMAMMGGGGMSGKQQADLAQSMKMAQVAQGGGTQAEKEKAMMKMSMEHAASQGPAPDDVEGLFAQGFMRSSSAFTTLAMGPNAKKLTPYIPRLLEVVSSGDVDHIPGMESHVFQTLSHLSAADPDGVYNHLDAIFDSAMSTSTSDSSLAMVIDGAAKASDSGAQLKCLNSLGALLMHPKLRPMSIPMVLGYITNRFEGLNDPKVLDPYMATIRSHKASQGVMVEKIEDFYAGRSLAKTDQKVDELAVRVDALNDDFAKQCKSFEDVNAMMDKKIADLKDFVGEVVKKLPQPCRLEVVGGVRKTLILHFACCATGATVTAQTADWHQWVKVGFGLIKLGKCLVEAAPGNPMAIVSGAGAIRDIYKGYKTKDDADFETFIKEPFLTSAESDRLINQLRAGGFFDKMEYDAQKGDWKLKAGIKGNQSVKEVPALAPIKGGSSSSSSAEKGPKGSWFGGKKASGNGGGDGGEGAALAAEAMTKVAALEQEVASLKAEVARLQPLEQKFAALEERVLKRLMASEKPQRI